MYRSDEQMTKEYRCGRLAQLVERLPYKERVRSSSLLTPTIKRGKDLFPASFYFMKGI